MPRGSKRLYKVRLIKRSTKTGEIISRKETHTQAVSKEQAEKFIHFRNPGYRITNIEEV